MKLLIISLLLLSITQAQAMMTKGVGSTLIAVDSSGESLFTANIVDMSYDADYCNLIINTDSSLICEGDCIRSDPNPPCTALINLDGHYYEITGQLENYPGIYFINSSATNCRLSNGQAIPASTGDTLILGIYQIPLPDMGLEILTRSWGDEVIMHSLPGNVVCAGTVEDPVQEPVCPIVPGSVFSDSFEGCD